MYKDRTYKCAGVASALILGDAMSSRQWTAAISIWVLVMSASGAQQAFSMGAVAIGIAPGGVVQGYAVGTAQNYPDEATARAKAIDACHRSTGSNAAAQSRCAVVATFNNQCFANAIDPKDGTPGVGWGIGDTQNDADALAMERCRNTAGPSRRQFCVVEDRHCDGTAK
jgi:hypothetical protein